MCTLSGELPHWKTIHFLAFPLLAMEVSQPSTFSELSCVCESFPITLNNIWDGIAFATSSSEKLWLSEVSVQVSVQGSWSGRFWKL